MPLADFDVLHQSKAAATEHLEGPRHSGQGSSRTHVNGLIGTPRESAPPAPAQTQGKVHAVLSTMTPAPQPVEAQGVSRRQVVNPPAPRVLLVPREGPLLF